METTAIRRPAQSAPPLAVQTSDGQWLAPCAPARARQLLRTGKARLVWHDARPHLQLIPVHAPASEPMVLASTRPAMSGRAA